MASVAASAVTALPSMAYERELERTDIQKQDINQLVMDYLVQAGCPQAAERFAEEANIRFDSETEMEARVEIRNAIYRGDIESAIDQTNDLDHEILDRNKPLHFSLLRLQLIELIKKIFPAAEADKPKLVGDAIRFAQQNLAPYAPANERFKNDLEQAMALLIVPKEAWQSPTGAGSTFGPLKQLISPELRMEVAKDLNAAILRSRCLSDHTLIHEILQTRAWAGDLAAAKGVELPTNMSISVKNASSASSASENGNGHTRGDDTQMTEDTGENTGTDPVTRYTNLS